MSLLAICSTATAQDKRTDELWSKLKSENHQVREQAGQAIFNIGLNTPIGDGRRLAAAQILFNAWQVETNRQTGQRLYIWIRHLGFTIQAMKNTETIGGERPYVVTTYVLVPGNTPRPKPKTSDNPDSTASITEEPTIEKNESESEHDDQQPANPESKTDKAFQAPEQEPFDPISLLPTFTVQRDYERTANAARAAVMRRSGDHLAHLPRMNGIHDQGEGSLDTDITKTCATNSRCLRTCPIGAYCIPCNPSERKRLAEMRKRAQKNPNAIQLQTQGLLNAIPLLIKIIQGASLEEILEPNF
jgi:hypothetical protein